ncbi:MAG: hypothetical protein AAGB48_13000 [Planctomycetota bacterium]
MTRRQGYGFGILIAYILPGFTLLASLSLLIPSISIWLLGPASASPAVGGVLYVTAASVLLGLLLGVTRWATLDRFHTATGITRPTWDERLLPERLAAFELLVENHFRYYEFYGNLTVGLPLAWLAFRLSEPGSTLAIGPIEAGLLIIETILFLGSRDALRVYFRRSSVLLTEEISTMTNGNHPVPKQTKPKTKSGTPKVDPKPATSTKS